MKLEPSQFTKDFPATTWTSSLPRTVLEPAVRFPYGDPRRQESFLYINQHLVDRFCPQKTQRTTSWLQSDAFSYPLQDADTSRKKEDAAVSVTDIGRADQDTTVMDRSWAAILAARTESPFACATNYGGHQFGHWAGQLGDGRAVLLGRICQNTEALDLQLKGAGVTPFSRQGDGKAVLRSSLREVAASVAMEAMGVPTTGVLSLCLSGEQVLRDRFYDGRPGFEPGAIVCRTATSFLRFGHFELPAARDQQDQLAELVAHAARMRFGDSFNESPDSLRTGAEKLMTSATHDTAVLIAHWQSLGFTHGVLNTDNMSLFGLTIDYGPYGFMDAFDPNYTPNTTDLTGRRYSFAQQPAICLWNLERLQEALRPLTHQTMPGRGNERMNAAHGSLVEPYSLSARFTESFRQAWSRIMIQKFGWHQTQSEQLSGEHLALVQRFFHLLEAESMDLNFAFRELAECLRDGKIGQFAATMRMWSRRRNPSPAQTPFDSWEGWARDHLHTLKDPERAGASMCRCNPRIVPKNHILQEVIAETEAGNAGPCATLMQILAQPFEDWRQHASWFEPAPPDRRGREFQMNSCSS
jgi:uncharacterized protein YdiU (UPF0061 family)